MNEKLITFEQLQKLSGYEKPAEVAVWLTREEIPSFAGKHNRPCTTLDAMNRSLGLGATQESQERIIEV